MKHALTILLAAGVGFAAAVLWMHRPPATRTTREIETTPAGSETGDAPAKSARAEARPRRAAPPPTAEEL